MIGAGNHKNAVVGRKPVHFVEEVAATLLGDNRVDILEDEQAWAHLSGHPEDISNHPIVWSILDVKRRDRWVPLGKGMHESFDRYRLSVSCRSVKDQTSLDGVSLCSSIF